MGLHGVITKWLNEQVKRNRGRFPKDFVFRLSRAEAEDEAMRSQFVTAYKRNVRHRPYAFTEHGAVMAANVLNSPSAVQMSVFVVRAFIKMRSLLTDRQELAGQLVELEKKLTARLDVHEAAIVDILKRIMELLDPPLPPPLPSKPPIGFRGGGE